jgi:manganese transport protein
VESTKVSASLSEVHSSVDTTNHTFFKRLFAFLGPAYLVSVGYMDPGNWATDIAAGSAFNYTLIWVLLLSNIMALILQSLSARLGIVTGRDLAQLSKEHYPKPVNIVLYVFAEIAIAACDLAEVLGFAIGLELVFHLPIQYGVLFALCDALLLLVILRLGIRKMEALIITLIFIIGCSFLVEVWLAHPQVGAIAKGFIPIIPNNAALYIAIGIIGATVMPHNLYLHSSLVQTRKIERTEKGLWQAIKYNFIDSFAALNIAFLVNAAILILAAAVFFKNNYHEVADIRQAHQLLDILIGNKWAPVLFGVALIASGQSSTITGTLAGQIVMEGYLNLRIVPWLRRLITRSLAVVPAFLVITLMGENETGNLLILSQVILSMQLGFAVIPLIHFVSDKKKMQEYTISIWIKMAAWICAIIILGLNIDYLNSFIQQLHASYGHNFWIDGLMIPGFSALGIILLYITFEPWLSIVRKTETEKKHELQLSLQQKFYRIAVTVDFSLIDEKTISQALAIGGNDAEYFLIHILESAAAIQYQDKANDLEASEDSKRLQQYAIQLQQRGFHASYELGFKSRKIAIPELVKKFNADLLIMGSHGHRGLKDLIFGETIQSVRHKINIPLLAVK